MSQFFEADVGGGPWCCVCGHAADVRVLHPRKGVRTVCDDHSRHYEVFEVIGADE